MVRQSRAGCPEAHIVMSGYSQGGQLVHNAAKLLGDANMRGITTIIFGDPCRYHAFAFPHSLRGYTTDTF